MIKVRIMHEAELPKFQKSSIGVCCYWPKCQAFLQIQTKNLKIKVKPSSISFSCILAALLGPLIFQAWALQRWLSSDTPFLTAWRYWCSIIWELPHPQKPNTVKTLKWRRSKMRSEFVRESLSAYFDTSQILKRSAFFIMWLCSYAQALHGTIS